MADGSILTIHPRRTANTKRRVSAPEAPRFNITVGRAATCKCCGVQVQPEQRKVLAFFQADDALIAYQNDVSTAAFRKEMERQCEAARRVFEEAEAKEPETGDMKIQRLFSEARKFVDKSTRHHKAARGCGDAAEVKAIAAYQTAKDLIDEVLATRASGIAGVAAKLAYVADEHADPDQAWHAGHRCEEMVLSVDADMRALLRRAGMTPAGRDTLPDLRGPRKARGRK